MNRIIILSLIILAMLLIVIGVNQNETNTDPSEYGNWNTFTLTKLASSFDNILPTPSTVEKYCTEYYYGYEHAPLGDSNFVIYVSLTISDRSEFERLWSQYKQKAETIFSDECRSVYFYRGSHIAISDYLDDSIHDGMNYCFETISIDTDNNSIDFLVSFVWDYYDNQVLIKQLKEVLSIIS